MHLFSFWERQRPTLPRRLLSCSVPFSKENRGFSLIELVVVTGIITIISTVLLAKQSQFDSTVLLRSLAYEVALSIRQAQIYGLSVREREQGSGNFEIGYGVHFTEGNPNSYILFADENSNATYDGVHESVEVFTLRRGFRIAQACGTLAGGTERCTSGELASLSIAFKRPDPDALIRSDLAGESYGSARIVILAPDGTSLRTVTVASTGQIEVEQSNE